VNPLPPAATCLAAHRSRFDHKALSRWPHDSSPPVSTALRTVPTAPSRAAAGSHASDGLCPSRGDSSPPSRFDILLVTTERRSVSLQRVDGLKVDGTPGGNIR